MIEAIIKVYPLALGLLLLIAANITLGSVGAQITKQFDIKVFAAGALKGFAVIISVTMAYIAGYLNQSLTFSLGGDTLSLMAAVNAVMAAAYAAYAVKFIEALRSLFKLKTSVIGEAEKPPDKE